jgi:exonuclease VII small subunit
VLGFIGTSVKPYDKYEYYRRDLNSAKAEVKQETEKPAKKPKQVKSSKEAGQRRAKLRDLEKEIASLEDQQKELEAAFGVNAKGDEYKKYGEIAAKLELLYDEYFALSEEN